MRLAGLLLVVGLVPSWGQISLKQQPGNAVAAKPAGATVAGATPSVAISTIAAVETDLYRRLAASGGTDPCVVKVYNRGLYVSGFGATFTSEVDLINSIGLGPFKTTITPQEKDQTHKRKLAHVPILEQTMREMVKASAAALRDLPETDQIVVAVRLTYRNWEDTSGLPGQIVMRMDRRGGDIKMELQ